MFKMITNKDLLTVWHMKLCSVLHGSLDGRGVWGRMDTCIYMALHCLPEATTILLVNGYVLMLSPFSCV